MKIKYLKKFRKEALKYIYLKKVINTKDNNKIDYYIVRYFQIKEIENICTCDKYSSFEEALQEYNRLKREFILDQIPYKYRNRKPSKLKIYEFKI
jgi:hypothetical protein